jgi:hypothetical protein
MSEAVSCLTRFRSTRKGRKKGHGLPAQGSVNVRLATTLQQGPRAEESSRTMASFLNWTMSGKTLTEASSSWEGYWAPVGLVSGSIVERDQLECISPIGCL